MRLREEFYLIVNKSQEKTKPTTSVLVRRSDFLFVTPLKTHWFQLNTSILKKTLTVLTVLLTATLLREITVLTPSHHCGSERR